MLKWLKAQKEQGMAAEWVDKDAGRVDDFENLLQSSRLAYFKTLGNALFVQIPDLGEFKGI